MNKFSVINYKRLLEETKAMFNSILARKLSPSVAELQKDDVLGTMAIEDFVVACGTDINSTSLVTNLYCRISAGIQAGSGNQILYSGVLNAYAESWNEISNIK